MNSPLLSRPLQFKSALAVAPVLLASCVAAGAQATIPPTQPSQVDGAGIIQVTGQASISVPADMVRVSFAVETEAPSASEASTRNAAQMDAVVTALRAGDFDGLQIETFGYSLTPDYRTSSRNEPSSRTIAGYRAVNHIRVSASDTDIAGEILDAAVDAGANRVVSLQFEASDTREARLEALRAAVRNAREEAETIAGAMDVELGPALEVSGGASPAGARVMFRNAAMIQAERVTTPLEAGTQEVSANVSITFRIRKANR